MIPPWRQVLVHFGQPLGEERTTLMPPDTDWHQYMIEFTDRTSAAYTAACSTTTVGTSSPTPPSTAWSRLSGSTKPRSSSSVLCCVLLARTDSSKGRLGESPRPAPEAHAHVVATEQSGKLTQAILRPCRGGGAPQLIRPVRLVLRWRAGLVG